MRELNFIEISNISGARIFPSDWIYSAAVGAMFGASCFVVTAFSANPVSLAAAITIGSSLGIGFHATHDILREFDL